MNLNDVVLHTLWNTKRAHPFVLSMALRDSGVNWLDAIHCRHRNGTVSSLGSQVRSERSGRYQ